MNTAEIRDMRSTLSRWINNLKEDELLALDLVRQSHESLSTWESLDKTTQRLIERGIADADAGRGVASETFWSDLKIARK